MENYDTLVSRAGLLIHWGHTQKAAYQYLCKKGATPNLAYLAVKGAVTLTKLHNERATKLLTPNQFVPTV